MTQKVTSYYIPQNLNIKKGKIYNLYLNKVTNLDLSSIISKEKEEPLTISADTYNNLLLLLDNLNNISTQSKELSKKITKRK